MKCKVIVVSLVSSSINASFDFANEGQANSTSFFRFEKRMESLSETIWDVLISGTGLQQSLLALALSRSGKKILHVDRNDYYGGPDAAFGLQEAESAAPFFSNASITQETAADAADSHASPSPTLSFSRAYSLSLSNQLIYARSRLLPLLVSSKLYHQLEFQAVGSWWIYDAVLDKDKVISSGNDESSSSLQLGTLRRVPTGREDLFADRSIDLRATRALGRFLKFVGDYENHQDVWEPYGSSSVSNFLFERFAIPSALQIPILAISGSVHTPGKTPTASALPRIARHLRSIGVFGPGFGAVVPKWGGSAEIAQVACRASAVGGGVYVLNSGIEAIHNQTSPVTSGNVQHLIRVRLGNGEEVSTRWVVGSEIEDPGNNNEHASGTSLDDQVACLRSIYIVSSPLASLFPALGDGSTLPAGAVVYFPSSTMSSLTQHHDLEGCPPVYINVHSSDTGECPVGQCVLYGSIQDEVGVDHSLLDLAVRRLLVCANGENTPEILFTMRYTQHSVGSRQLSDQSEPTDIQDKRRIIMLPPPSSDLVFDDGVLDRVRGAWESIMGDIGNGSPVGDFMEFEDRERFPDDGD
ncbi:MAG: Rab proteins geranylgeranyltransferase component A [Caeruleum heppii]|nr:MAG: Rab proteins geranylgeranyltransferase component A [Caeruleum heppii]